MPSIAVILGLTLVLQHQDTSFAEQTSRKLTKDEANEKGDRPPGAQATDGPKGIAGTIDGVRGGSGQALPEAGNSSRASRGGEGVKYRAAQIIGRPGGDPDRKLPIGTSFIGRLLNAIDSREQNSFVRAIIPYGASFDHDRRLDRNSILFGTATYPDGGEKVYVKFTRVLLPNGQEFKIEAQALSSLDYAPGLTGEEHDGAGGRIGTTLGLTMLSGITDVMVQREALGQYGAPTPKAGLRNGLYNGIARATENEAQRRAAKINDAKDYVTIEAGQDVIISLTETFKGENL